MEDVFSEKKVLEMEMDETLTKQIRFIGIIQQVMGVLNIISGAFMCLTIIGAAAGVPIIMGGINVFKSGGFMSDTALNNSGSSLKEALGNFAKGLKLLLIGFIIWIVLYILFFVVVMILGVFASASGY